MKKRLQFTLVSLAIFALSSFAQVFDNAEVKKTDKAPVMDGLLIDAAWAAAERHSSDTMVFIYSGDPADAKKRKPFADTDKTASSFEWQATWDDANLYVAVTITDANVIRDDSEYLGPDDDGFDFNIGLPDAVSMIVINVEPDLDTAHYTGNKGSGYVDLNATLRSNKVKIFNKTTDFGWNMEFAIPWAVWGNTPAKGTVLKFGPKYNDDNGNVPDGADAAKSIREEHFAWGCSTVEKWNSWDGHATITLDDELLPTVSLFKSNAPTFQVYPNPANDVINLTNVELGAKISILNLVGQEVISSEANDSNVELNVANLISGVYFVKVDDSAQKIIIE